MPCSLTSLQSRSQTYTSHTSNTSQGLFFVWLFLLETVWCRLIYVDLVSSKNVSNYLHLIIRLCMVKEKKIRLTKWRDSWVLPHWPIYTLADNPVFGGLSMVLPRWHFHDSTSTMTLPWWGFYDSTSNDGYFEYNESQEKSAHTDWIWVCPHCTVSQWVTSMSMVMLTRRDFMHNVLM